MSDERQATLDPTPEELQPVPHEPLQPLPPLESRGSLQPLEPLKMPELPAPAPEVAPAPGARQRYGLALLLWALTLFCTTTLGPVLYVLIRTDVVTNFAPFITPALISRVWQNATLLRLGLLFSLPALSILLAHEMGHYLACRYYRLPATLPYFLPFPATLGTLGAFIRIRSPLRTKRELFDVGVAGPLAGFVVLLPFLLIGVARSEPAPMQVPAGSVVYLPGQCLAIQLASLAFHGRLPAGFVLNLHPFAMAAWFGLLATAINLLPFGQLDGGHILYAAGGRWQRRLAIPLLAALFVAGFLWKGWFLWFVLVLVLGLYHPPVLDERTPLDAPRQRLALAALVIFLLSFTPQALKPVEGPVSGSPASQGRQPGAWVALPPGQGPNRQAAPSVPVAQNSATKVTGPSLTSSTSI